MGSAAPANTMLEAVREVWRSLTVGRPSGTFTLKHKVIDAHLTIYGIRHHGPGSAKRLKRALRVQQPDCILVELPQDTEKVLPKVADEGLRPPVALLAYNPKDFNQAAYLPFAEFSPEWQALRHGVRFETPAWPIDLPLSLQFGLHPREAGAQLRLPEELSEEAMRIQTDPLGFIAELAGFSDSERWWEITFEQAEEDETFEIILDMMRTLRRELDREETRETLLREAHMRKMIRKAVKEGYHNIAVVCGAWHAPALQDVQQIKASADNKLLRGLKKIKTAVTWIPWSYDRLARQAGYRAGVVSPAWYALLFKQRPEVTIRWMSRVARLLRRQEVDASAAHVEEAVRLAETLATLRRRQLPGLEELEEAALAVFCQGDAALLELIHGKLVIGDALGKVPSSIPAVPLQKDLEKAIKSARLTQQAETTERIRKELDLRKPTNLQASLLLHRLNILGIPWGRLLQGSANRISNFKEEWSLKWKPDFSIRIIEASALGNTVEEASTEALLKSAADSEDLALISGLVEEALRADLTEAVDPIIIRMRELAALTRDIFRLMTALPAMASVVAYGDTRQTDTEAVEQLVDEIIPRICIGLPPAGLQIEDESARELFQQTLRTHHAIHLLQKEENSALWQRALHQLINTPGIHPLMHGAATRILFDKGELDAERTERQVHFQLSSGSEAHEAAQWLEGFLHGSGLLLLHNTSLWEIIDNWVQGLNPETFQEMLPVLRRIFAHFLPAERQKMLSLAKEGRTALEEAAGDQPLVQARTEKVLPTVRLLLGLTQK